MNSSDAQILVRQIGGRTIMAISGRPAIFDGTDLIMKSGTGHRVRVELSPMDTWTVHREYVRAGKVTNHGTATDIYPDQVGDCCWDASRYVNVEFPGGWT